MMPTEPGKIVKMVTRSERRDPGTTTTTNNNDDGCSTDTQRIALLEHKNKTNPKVDLP